MLTVIIPIDLQFRAIDILKKCDKLLKSVRNIDIELIFGHNNRGSRSDIKFLKLINASPKSKVVTDKFYENTVNTSILRNRAISLARTEYICLLDIDIWPDIELLEKYKLRIKQNLEPFYILPCLYLTKLGTKLLSEQNISKEILLARYYSFSRKEFLHLASPSSITIMRRLDYKKLNGFNEKYSGHGFEDFDFLIRLGLLHNKLMPRKDFTSFNHARSPLFAIGFKRYIGELCLDQLIEKDLAFHLYHHKDPYNNYYASRTKNFNLFQKDHSKLNCGDRYLDTTLITKFVELCIIKNVNLQEYSIYFDNKPGHIDRVDTLKRKLNFLLSR